MAERLPENPLVITPWERVGPQGGDWNHALVGGGSASMLVRYQGYDGLVRYTSDWSGIELNVAESCEINADATEYTIKLRKGHEVVGRPAVHHRRRAVLVRRLSHRCRNQPGRQRLVVGGR